MSIKPPKGTIDENPPLPQPLHSATGQCPAAQDKCTTSIMRNTKVNPKLRAEARRLPAETDATSSRHPPGLTIDQAQSFQRDIEACCGRPGKSLPLLRILRDLQAQEISNYVLSHTQLQITMLRLRKHSYSGIRHAAGTLAGKWSELKDVSRPTNPSARPRSASMAERRIGRPLESEAPRLRSSSEGATTVGFFGPLTADKKLVDRKKSKISTPIPFSLNNSDSLMHCGGIAAPATCDRAHPNPSETTKQTPLLDKAKVIAKLEHSNKRLFNAAIDELYEATDSPDKLDDHEISDPVQMSEEEFQKMAASYLGLGCCGLHQVEDELGPLYINAVNAFRLAVTTTASRSFMQKAISDVEQCVFKDTTGTQLDTIPTMAEQTTAETTTDLMQLRSNLHHKYLEAFEQSKEALHAQETIAQHREAKMFKSLLGPSKHIMDVLVFTQARLSDATKSLQASRRVETNLIEQVVSLKTTTAKLKQEVKSERYKISSKYYKDIETRVQEEKSRLSNRLREAEAKAQQHDAIAAHNLELQKQLKDVIYEKSVLTSSKLNLDARCKELEATVEVTQQGYEQMRLEKEEAEMRAITLEEDNRNLQSFIETNVKDPPNVSSGSTNCTLEGKAPTSAVQIITHNQLTEADRLELIAQYWRGKLERVESEHKHYIDAIAETNAQIAFAEEYLKNNPPQDNRRGSPNRRQSARSFTNSSSSSSSRPARFNGQLTATEAVRIVPIVRPQDLKIMDESAFPPLAPPSQPAPKRGPVADSVRSLRIT